MRNVILIGFMGTGKSETGRILASSLGLKFLDTDTMIEVKTGGTIPALFERSGEAGFRAVEKEIVSGLEGRERCVISTGGGAVVDQDNLDVLKSIGTVVHLSADPATILSRTDGDAGMRPMLAGGKPLDRVKGLLNQRSGQYAQADMTIDTSDCDPGQVASQIIDRIDGASRRIEVALGDASYDIIIGTSTLPRLGLCLREFDLTSRALIVTNSGLNELYGATVVDSLLSAGFEPEVSVIRDGEEFKTLESASRLYDAMLDHRMDRKSPVIALGGGVTGDLSGHVAATFMRGVPFVQVPTSLLAQVDASVGGKVAVDHPRGKNLIGAFYQPQLVLISLDTLNTLPDQQLSAGLAEVIKYCVISDEGFFEYIEANLEAALSRDHTVLSHIVARSCELKAEVVAGDEREHGIRAILNFGHTIGHAIEIHTGILHGEAVSIGMVYAGMIAQKMDLWTGDSVARLVSLLKRARLPVSREGLDTEAILSTMLHDKKTVGGKLRFILPRGFGQVEIRKDVAADTIEEVLLGS